MITRRVAAILAVGAVLLCAAGTLGSPSARWPWWAALGLLAFLAVLSLVDLALAASISTVTLSRAGDRVMWLDESANVDLTVHNGSPRFMRARLRDAWVPSAGAAPYEHWLDIEPGGRATITPPWTIRVLPRCAARRFLPEKLARLRVLDGAVVIRGRGQGTEFDALREYVVGDDVRSIDWRASARRSDVVVRTWRPERDRRVLCVLDTGRTSAARVGDEPRLDAAIDAALPVLSRLAARHKVVVAAVYDPALAALSTLDGRTEVTVDDVYTAAAAQRALAERERVRAALTRYGVEVVDAPIDVFASRVADAYLAMKAAGRL